jgi:hypothetical protein
LQRLTYCRRSPTRSCFEDPTQPNCSDAEIYYPTDAVLADVATICALLPQAAGCSVRRQCDAGLAAGSYCQPFSLLADLCGGVDSDAQRDSHCTGWRNLCGVNATVVKQCRTRPAMPGLVSSQSAQKSVGALCAQMPDMKECAECRESCPDPLLAYSSICVEMKMDGCEAWAKMCDSNPPGLEAFCGKEDEAACSGMMQMYFHNGFEDYILFKSWVPCTQGRYLGSCLGVVLLGVFVAFLKAVRVRLEYRFQRARHARESRDRRMALEGNGSSGDGDQPAGRGGGLAEVAGEGATSSAPLRARGRARDSPAATPLLMISSQVAHAESEGFFDGILPSDGLQLQQNLVRGIMAGLTLALDYMLMLVAMTFNIGLFLAVCLGVVVGTVLFGHQHEARGRSGAGAGFGGGAQLLEERSCCSS